MAVIAHSSQNPCDETNTPEVMRYFSCFSILWSSVCRGALQGTTWMHLVKWNRFDFKYRCLFILFFSISIKTRSTRPLHQLGFSMKVLCTNVSTALRYKRCVCALQAVASHLRCSTWDSCPQKQKCCGWIFNRVEHAWCCRVAQQTKDPSTLQVPHHAWSLVFRWAYGNECGVSSNSWLLSVT